MNPAQQLVATLLEGKPKIENLIDEVSRETLLKRSKGGVVTPEYRVPTENVVAKIDQSLETAPNFCRYQPKIQQFAFGGPDNMAATLIFVLASQMKDWPSVQAHFPSLMQHIRQQGRLKPYPDEVPWKGLVYTGGNSIEWIWAHRNQIYSRVEAIDDDVALYKYLLTLPGLGLPKAGFASQLIKGRFGCIDSVNANLFGVPRGLTEPDSVTGKPVFRNVSFFKDQIKGELTKRGNEYAEMYLSFLDSIKRASSSSIAQQLWDDWCNIVGHKIWYASQGAPSLEIGTEKGPIRVPAYKPSTLVQQAKPGLAQPEAPGLLSPTAGATIGSQHHSVLQRAAESLVNRMLESDLDNLVSLEQVLQSPKLSYRYAKELGQPFPEGEPAIATSATYSYFYALEVLKRPFPEGEPAIATNAVYSHNYAVGILKKPFPEGEPAIAKNAEYSYLYAQDVLKDPKPKTWRKRYPQLHSK